MAEQKKPIGFGAILNARDLVVPAMIMTVILFMLFPLPAITLDMFLAMNIAFSFLILLVALYTKEPLQFSSFPSLLLVATLMRLSFNVAASRLILTHGNEGPDAAGNLIEAFGNFVGGNDAIVGFIVFIILVVIQFVVLTSGAQRVSEVAARFTLDAMPGKQMAIDADLNAGLISEDDARSRRKKIEQEANFFGAMDGASKFVRGDAIAAIVVVLINIIGGFAVGMFRGSMTAIEVLERYTLLTMGDGLVTIIPAVVVSTATGMIATRSASENNLSEDLTRQLTFHTRPLVIVSTALLIMALFFPGPSKLPLLGVAALGGLGTWMLTRNRQEEATQAAAEQAAMPLAKEPENVTSLLQVDPMELEIGFGLIPLVEENQGGDLLDRITMIRRQTALELGLVVPPIRIRDNMQLPSEGYSVKIRGTEVASGELKAGRFLAINSTGKSANLNGLATREPTFGLPAIWIEESQKDEAEQKGYTVVDLPSVIATHVTEVVRSNAQELLTRQDVVKLIDNVKKTNSAVVDELIPSLLSLGDIQKILQNLLKERIPIRDMVTMLETLSDRSRSTKDTDTLTEFVRQSLFRVISRLHMGPDEVVRAMTLDPRLEQKLSESIQRNEAGTYLAVDPRLAQKIMTSLSRQIEIMNSQGFSPLVLCSPTVRIYFKRLIEKLLPNLIVLSYNELDSKVEIQTTGMVSVDEN